MVLWNFTQTTERVGEHYGGTLDFWKFPDTDDQAYGFLTAVNPAIIGYRGPITKIAEENVSWVEGLGESVQPDSLFEAPIEHRLGRRPVWLDNALADWERLLAGVAPTELSERSDADH